MVIVLFFFVLLFFPLRFTAKIIADVKNAHFAVSLFLFKILATSVQIFSYQNKLYYAVSRFEPKPIKFNKNKKKTSTKPVGYDFFKGERLVAVVKIGTFSPALSIMLSGALRIIFPRLCHIIDERVSMDVIPDFFDNNLMLYSDLTVFTCLGLVIFQFIKRALKGVKYAIQQSH